MPLLSADKREDILLVLGFTVEVEGIVRAAFSECSGLGSSVQVEKWDEGGYNAMALKFPGRTEFDNVTLKRGFTTSMDLEAWFLHTTQGGPNVERKNVTIRLMDMAQQKPIKTWVCANAFPTKWSASAMDVKGNGVAVESIEFAHEGFLKT